MGELVDLSSQGLGWSATGDGTLSVSTEAQATLTAGATAGSVTVNIGGRGTICTKTSLTFTVIAPTVSYFNHNNIVGHVQNYASIAKSSDVYLGPDTVSFSGLSYSEVQKTFSGTGAWSCKTGVNHASNPPPILTVVADVQGYGSFAGYDTADSGYCPTYSPQITASSEYVDIPTQYEVSGSTWQPINPVVQQATEDASGNLSLTKDDHTSGQTTVSSPTVTNY